MTLHTRARPRHDTLRAARERLRTAVKERCHLILLAQRCQRAWQRCAGRRREASRLARRLALPRRPRPGLIYGGRMPSRPHLLTLQPGPHRGSRCVVGLGSRLWGAVFVANSASSSEQDGPLFGTCIALCADCELCRARQVSKKRRQRERETAVFQGRGEPRGKRRPSPLSADAGRFSADSAQAAGSKP